MREKLLNLMKSEGLTSSRLAEILEIQPSGVSHILSGRNKPGFDLLQKILRRFPRINPDWLLLDSDRMYRQEHDVLPASNASTADHDLFAASSTNPEHNRSTTSPLNTEPSTKDNSSLTVQTKSAEAVRVVVFYADQTFDSYTPKR